MAQLYRIRTRKSWGESLTVGMSVGQIGAGHSIEEVLAEYPYLERQDVLQALRYLPPCLRSPH